MGIVKRLRVSLGLDDEVEYYEDTKRYKQMQAAKSEKLQESFVSGENPTSYKYKLAGETVSKKGTEHSGDIRSHVRNQRLYIRELSPEYLKNVSDVSVVNAMIRKINNDLGSKDWTLVVEDGEISDEKLEKIKYNIKNLHHELSFEEFRERWSDERLRTGEAAIIINKLKKGEIKVKLPATQTMFKKVDKRGKVTEYIQRINNQTYEFDVDEVIWSHYYPPLAGEFYGRGPVHDAIDSFKILDSLRTKNRRNLERGVQNGVLTVSDINENVVNKREWKIWKNRFQNNKGKREVVTVAPPGAELNFVNLTDEWSDLDWKNRKHDAVKEFAANVGVPASVVHYIDDSMNFNQDENQENIYQKSALEKNLNDFESLINELIDREFDADVRFEFERGEQRERERKKELQRKKELAKTKKELNEAGIESRVEDGEIVISEAGESVEESEKSFADNDYSTRREEIEERFDDDLENIMRENIKEEFGNVTKIKSNIEEKCDGQISKATIYTMIDDLDLKHMIEEYREKA